MSGVISETDYIMDSSDIIKLLEHKGVKATANRILVLKALHDVHKPMCLSALEDAMPDMDKSSIFRVMSIFLEHDVVHAFEDGRGVVNYELCSHDGDCNHTDGHIHFYCESCHQSYCLENQQIPTVSLPNGFESHSVSFVVKGVCPECRKHSK